VSTKVKIYLVLCAGFSKINAEKAIELYDADQLQQTEKEVISKIFADPYVDSSKDELGRAMPVPDYRVLTHLNMRLTSEGGSARTEGRKC
jgi:hypothetical protein